jgi:chemotaxis protein methyltransferase CheR
MRDTQLSDQEFAQFQNMIYEQAGISMSPAKRTLIAGRLSKRLRHYGLVRYSDYFNIITGGNGAELQIAIDLLTTNETHFFREPKHFDFLRSQVLPQHRPGRPFRVWSAASSSGEEAYSIAMLLADVLGSTPWEILGSDISTRVLERARQGHYSMERAQEIPRPYLTRFCLKGTGSQDGTLLISRELRERVQFQQVNLIEPLPKLGEFDVIFLRNVMIYFDQNTKVSLVSRMLPLLRPGGYFLISHSESLNGISTAYEVVAPAIYRKPGGGM